MWALASSKSITISITVREEVAEKLSDVEKGTDRFNTVKSSLLYHIFRFTYAFRVHFCSVRHVLLCDLFTFVVRVRLCT